jgi:hypothetical protein
MRYLLSNESNSFIAGYDGSQGWLRTKTNGKILIQSLDAEALRSMREQIRFDSPLFCHQEEREDTIKLIERTTLDGRSVLVLEVLAAGSEVSRYYLDLITAHIVRVDHLDAEGELSIQTLYRDYLEVEGFPFAFEIETRVGGETPIFSPGEQD